MILLKIQKTSEEKTENPRDVLLKQLGFRGIEVLTNAESQFPNETKMIVVKLSELIKSGEINETIDGGKLLTLFRSVGLNVRMETKINVQQDGKFVSLTDKLSKTIFKMMNNDITLEIGTKNYLMIYFV